MSEKQDPNHDQNDDDLLADFSDVLGDDSARPASSESGDEELADLDAFLNEFGQSGGEGASADPQVEEFGSAASTAPAFAGGDELHELDVSMDEPVPELGAEDIVEAAAMDAPEELDLDVDHVADEVGADALDEYVSDLDVHYEAAPEVSAAPRSTPALFDAVDDSSHDAADYQAAHDALIADEEEETEVGKKLDVSTIGVALFSLVIAAVVGWFAVSLHSQVAELKADMGRMGQPSAAALSPQLDAELARINQRLNTLASTVTTSTGHAGGNEQVMSALNTRLDDLDKSVASLRAQLIAQQRAPSEKSAAATAVQQPVKAKPPAKAKAAQPAKKRTLAASGAWVVNVASLTDAKAAQSESARLRHEGIKNIAVEKVTMNGRIWYRVRVTGFSSREEAQVYSDMIKNKLAGAPWVGHR